MSTLQLLIHAPTEAALQRALANAANLLHQEPDAQVEIVVNASAVKAAVWVTDPQIVPLLRLCRNSLDNQGLTAPAGMEQIPAAIAHLARRQQEGWGYVRA